MVAPLFYWSVFSGNPLIPLTLPLCFLVTTLLNWRCWGVFSGIAIIRLALLVTVPTSWHFWYKIKGATKLNFFLKKQLETGINGKQLRMVVKKLRTG